MHRPDPQPAHGAELVQSLERGLAVVRAFDPSHPRFTMSQVAQQTGLIGAGARRLLLSSQSRGSDMPVGGLGLGVSRTGLVDPQPPGESG
jgi:hypothetical protein